MSSLGVAFFTGKGVLWNIFDFGIVLLGIFDFLVDNVIPSVGTAGFDFYNEMLKMLRLLRLFRLFKLFRMFKQLYMLATGLLDSLEAVFWVSMMCLLFLYACSVFLTQVIGK